MRNIERPGRRSETLERARHTLRAAVCRGCFRRPPGSESLGPDTPRACEPACEVFAKLPALLEAAECVDPMLGSVERALNTRISDVCHDAAARAVPGRAPAGRCPLARYRRRVIRVLRMVVGN